uniref:Uncharacterized protein n=1 Tax=Arundo donax TaxID=35708 RepID=A0A0A9A8Q7_ARUDO
MTPYNKSECNSLLIYCKDTYVTEKKTCKDCKRINAECATCDKPNMNNFNYHVSGQCYLLTVQ